MSISPSVYIYTYIHTHAHATHVHISFCLYIHIHIYTHMHTPVDSCKIKQLNNNTRTHTAHIHMHTYRPPHQSDRSMRILLHIKLIAFELAAKFSRRGENPVQPRLYNTKNALFKRLKTVFSLPTRSSPANSNAISFTHHIHMHNLFYHVLSEYTYT